MMSTQRSSRSNVRTLWLCAGALALCGAAVLALLWLADPQWNRWIYVFQAYVKPGHPAAEIYPPPGYSGTWVTWYRNGRKRSQTPYAYGVLHGRQMDWYDDGSIFSVSDYKRGRREGKYEHWARCGLKKIEGTLLGGERHGEWKYWGGDGSLSGVKVFRHGVLITWTRLGPGTPNSKARKSQGKEAPLSGRNE